MIGKHAIYTLLQQHGVSHIFGNPGTTEIELMDGLADFPGISYVLAAHESAAVAMADGYYRASGQPGVLSLHATPGTGNAVGNLYNARHSGSPLVCITGQQHGELLLGEPFLSSNITRIVEPVVKWTWEVRLPAELPEAVRRAFKTAQEPPAGPVFVSVTRDVLNAEVQLPEARPVTVRDCVAPDDGTVADIVDRLIAAERPVLLAGDEIGRYHAVAEAIALAELLGLEVHQEAVQGNWNFPSAHPLLVGRGGFDAPSTIAEFAGADLLLAVGARVFTEYLPRTAPLLRSDVELLQVNLDPHEIGKNIPPAIGVIGHPKATLLALARIARERLTAADEVGIEARRRLIAERKADSDRVAAAQLKADWEAVPIKPSRVMHELGKAMPPETMLLDESVNSASHLRRYVDFAGENTYFTYKGGALGWGIGAALGAKLARPDRPALAVVGDGSALFGIQALWSVQRSGLPLVTVVLNNQTYMAVKSGIAAYRGAEVRPYVGVDLGENDFARLAEAFGLVGRTVDRPEQLAPAFEQAFASDRAVVIDVKIDPLDTGYGRPPLSPGK